MTNLLNKFHAHFWSIFTMFGAKKIFSGKSTSAMNNFIWNFIWVSATMPKFRIPQKCPDRNSLPEADTVFCVVGLIHKDIVGELISKMRNEKAAGPPGLVSEIVKAARETEV